MAPRKTTKKPVTTKPAAEEAAELSVEAAGTATAKAEATKAAVPGEEKKETVKPEAAKKRCC